MLKKIWIFAAALLLTAAPAFAQVVLEPATRDFGKVRPGHTYSCQARITNNTSSTVTLTAPQTGAPGVTATLKETVLKPKEFTWLSVDYRPAEAAQVLKNGRITLEAKYSGKAGKPASKPLAFNFSSQYASSYSLIPGKLSASYPEESKFAGVEGRLVLDKAAYPGWKPGQADAGGNSFTAKVQAVATASFSVRLEPAKPLAAGNYEGKITIPGAGKGAKTFEYPYAVKVNGQWIVEPRTLDVGRLDAKRTLPWKMNMQVRHAYGNSFKVSKVEGAPLWLKYKIAKNKAGSWQVLWELDEAKLAGNKEKGKPVPDSVGLVVEAPKAQTVVLPLKASWADNKPQTVKIPEAWMKTAQSTPFSKKPISQMTPFSIKDLKKKK